MPGMAGEDAFAIFKWNHSRLFFVTAVLLPTLAMLGEGVIAPGARCGWVHAITASQRAAAIGGGTAFPICLTTASRLPVN